MAVFDLSIEDLETFNRLIKITKAINNLYGNLYELEKNGESQTPEFQENLNRLRLAVEVEDNMYQELDLTPDRCFTFIQYVLETKLPDDFPNNLTSLANLEYDNKIYRRIITKIMKIQKLTYGDTLVKKEEVITREILARTYGLKNNKEEARFEYKINEGVFVDFYNFYLYFVTKALKESDLPFNSALLLSKYYLAFIDKDVEENLLKNGFTFTLPSFYFSEYQKSLETIPNAFFENRKSDLVETIVVSLISSLMSIRDTELSDMRVQLKQLIIGYLLKSALVIDEETGAFIIEMIFNEIKDESLEGLSTSIKLIKKALQESSLTKKEVEKAMFLEDGVWK